MKLIKQENGYSFYENPDKDLVDKIKNIDKSLTITRLFQYPRGIYWTLKEITGKGKYLMEDADGNMITIEKSDYDEQINEQNNENSIDHLLESD